MLCLIYVVYAATTLPAVCMTVLYKKSFYLTVE